MYQGKLELSIAESGELTTYQNGAWQIYRAVDTLLFQNTSKPEQYLSFQRDASGKISRLYTNINLAGFYVPMSFSPVPWYDNPDFINEYYFLFLLFIITFILVPFFRLWVLIRRRKNPEYKVGKLAPNSYVYIALLVLALYLCQLLGGFFYLVQNVNEFYFGVPNTFRWVQLITWSIPPAIAFLIFATVRLWQNESVTIWFRTYGILICLCAVIHLLFLYRWHFIGLHV